MGLRDLIARLSLDTKGYEAGLNQAERLTGKWAKKQEKYFTKQLIGAFSVGHVIGQIRDTFKEASKLNTDSAKQGLSPEFFQALTYASDKTGISVEDLVKQVGHLPPEVRDAIEEFRRLGLATDGVDKLSRGWSNIEISIRAASKGVETLAGWAVTAGEALGRGLNIMGALTPNPFSKVPLNAQAKVGSEMLTDEMSRSIYNPDADENDIFRKTQRLNKLLADKAKLKDTGTFRTGYTSDFQSINRHVNSLQSIGAGIGGSDQMTVEIRKQVQLLEEVNGTLKEIHEEKQFTVDPLQ